jgi:hypothetical protein
VLASKVFPGFAIITGRRKDDPAAALGDARRSRPS